MKRDMLSEVSVAVWGVCEVSPEEEKKGCGGKDLRKKTKWKQINESALVGRNCACFKAVRGDLRRMWTSGITHTHTHTLSLSLSLSLTQNVTRSFRRTGINRAAWMNEWEIDRISSTETAIIRHVTNYQRATVANTRHSPSPRHPACNIEMDNDNKNLRKTSVQSNMA